MKRRRPRSLLLYNDSTDIGVAHLEKILQGLVWLADGIVLPSIARPDPLAPEEDQDFIRNRLGELAEAHFLDRWDIEHMPLAVRRPSWWPREAQTHTIEPETYEKIQSGVQEGVSAYRLDLLRGVGRREGAMLSGVTEFVMLRDSLWSVGLARYVGADFLLSSEVRTGTFLAPLRRLSDLGSVLGPVSQTIMELHGIERLAGLTVGDIRGLRKYLPTTRQLLTNVAQNAEDHFATTTDRKRYVDQIVDSARQHYAAAMGHAVENAERADLTSDASGVAVTIAGMVFPPLQVLSFAQPLMSWSPHGREGRRLVMFLTKLKRRAKKT